jgi:hypothetical protein
MGVQLGTITSDCFLGNPILAFRAWPSLPPAIEGGHHCVMVLPGAHNAPSVRLYLANKKSLKLCSLGAVSALFFVAHMADTLTAGGVHVLR